MPIVSYHSTLIASLDDISHATQYFNSQASSTTTYLQSEKSSITASPSRIDLSASSAPRPPTTAEPASEEPNVITTSHILLSRGVKDDPSLPNSSCTSPTQRQQEEEEEVYQNPVDFAVTTVWESTGKKVMTFGVASGAGLVRKVSTSGRARSGGEELTAETSKRSDKRSEEATRKASEWLGLTPKTKGDASVPHFEAEKQLYERWWPNNGEADRRTACTHSENGTMGRAPDMPTTRPRRDTPEDYDLPDLPGLSQPVATRIVSNLEDRTSALSYDSIEAQRSWPSISDFGSDVDNILPRRGRSLIRTDRVPNPFSRASSRNRQNNATVEVNVRFMEPRLRRSSTFFDDPTEPVAKLEDKLLEPLPRVSICASVSEVLNLEDTPAVKYQKRYSEAALELAYTFSTARPGSGTSISIDPNRKTSSAIASALASNKGSRRASQTMSYRAPQAENQDFRPDAEKNFEAQLDLLPVSPNLHPVCLKEKHLARTPPALSIPAEIMHNIYLHLGPVDFDAARHVCRLWYINSLEYSLLDTMLRRGGWSSSVQRELATNRTLGKPTRVNEEWLMSKHLARECALGPDWRGNGMLLTACEREVGMEQERRHTAFKLISKVDFRSAGVNYDTKDLDSCGMLFTVSSCSKFLMVSQGCIVYIYELNRSHRTYRGQDKDEGGALRPFTSIICPRRVLACSMDTSSNRDAIAILMDGRMGLVCAVTGNSNRSGKATHMRDLRKMQEQSNIFPVSRGGSWRNNVSLGTSHSSRNYNSHDQRLHVSVMASEERLSTGSGSPFDPNGTDDELDYHYTPPAPRSSSLYPKLVAATYPMPIEASPPTLYALLCSADDPPRSVALCPQRRCVAFGCSSGIELHWVDALTGEDLNRWFPLTAPSDYLYFLPPRAGVDSAKKLRLVSSQGSPAEKATISERFSGRKKHSAFWGVEDIGSTPKGFFSGGDNVPDTRTATGAPRPRGGSDHYRAVPLSDGYHLLFTDPASGVLCLGNDAPLGGPTKLLRKMWFSGPAGEGSPIAYAAGSDLRWGVRVVAAYGMGREQSIWLFSVPADIFADGARRGEVAAGRGSSTAGACGAEGNQSFRGNTDWIPWWGTTGGRLLEWSNLGYGGGSNIMWPVMVRGQEIGHFSELADLAIHSGPDIGITVWAFGRQGVTLTWNVEGRGDCSVKHRWVVRDGTVRGGDGQGDVEMCDADVVFPESPEEPSQNQEEDKDPRGMRGTASYDGALLSPDILSPGEGRSLVESFERDADGDVLMEDLPASASFSESGYDSGSEAEGSTEPGMFEQSWRLEGGEQWARRFSAHVEDEDDSYVRTSAGRRGDRDGEFFGVERGRWDEALGSVQEERLSGGDGTTQDRRRRNVDLVEELTGVARIDIEIR